MTNLPNPFDFADPTPRSADPGAAPSHGPRDAAPEPYSALEPARVAESAAAPDLTDPPVAAAEHRFVLDVEAFTEALEEPPMFLASPSPEYQVAQLLPALKILAAY